MNTASDETGEGLTDDVVKVRKEWHAEKDGNQPFLTSE
jgi:hypothetical protein